MAIQVLWLGQSGFRFCFDNKIIYTDPYLTDSVAKLDGPDMRRVTDIPFPPTEVTDAHWVLISHLHQDHCDLETLVPLAKASPQCRFISPKEVSLALIKAGISETRVISGEENCIEIEKGIRIFPVPAAHPNIEYTDKGFNRYLGYVIEMDNKRLYFAGDTSVHEELIKAVKKLAPIHTAILPINERNFFRERRGIVGNMTLREAFLLTEEIGASHLIPMHWDMFSPNAVFKQEIELLYELIKPNFKLSIDPKKI